MLMLSSVLVDENNALHIRNAASLALKNTLTARVRLDNHCFFSFKNVFPHCLLIPILGNHAANEYDKSLACPS